jgi:AcrR family transcriptional regulator
VHLWSWIRFHSASGPSVFWSFLYRKNTRLYISLQTRGALNAIHEVSRTRRVFSLKALQHKQERAIITRDQLIEAARFIFARNGFESARIEDIASRAKKTRGAFYDHFRDKEDVFFAIFEEDIARDEEKIAPLLANAKSVDERSEAFSKYLTGLLHDRQRILLNLEFKMYVIRHPQKRKRLSNLYNDMCLRCGQTKINTVFPELIDASMETRHRLTSEYGAIIFGLALNALFDPEGLKDDRRERYIQMATEEVIRETQRAALAEDAPDYRNSASSTEAAIAL